MYSLPTNTSPFQSQSQSKPLTPNLLPCSIKHNGPITTSPRHWSPQPSTTTTSSTPTLTSYFRGRKLHGRVVKLPPKYQGVIIQKTDRILALTALQQRRIEEDDIEDGDGLDEDGDVGMGMEKAVEVKVLEEKGRFEEMVVWGHEVLPEESGDGYVRAVGEWVGFAEAMHAYDSPVEEIGSSQSSAK